MNRLRNSSSQASQRGAALVIGLILLMVLTLLAVSSMNTSSLELQMAGNTQFSQNAFQAAETGIETAMRSGVYNTNVVNNVPATLVPSTTTDRYQTRTAFDANTGVTPVPSGGFSLGTGTGFQAYHFDIQSTGTSSRQASAVNNQSFYVVGPSGN